MDKTENEVGSFYVPQELLLEIGKMGNRLLIGIPAEKTETEKRLALTPEAVQMLTMRGHKIIVQSGAGIGINYSDNHYAEAGALIVSTSAEVYQADIILKMFPPTVLEVAQMKPRSTLFSFLQFASFSEEAFHLMMSKRITAIAYELLCDEERHYPVMNMISEIEGNAAVMIVASLLSNRNGGKGILMGGIPGVSPTEIVVVGAGNSGCVVARLATAMGASVKVFDDDLAKLRHVQQAIGHQIFTSTFHPHVLDKAFKNADVVIGAMRYINAHSRYIISEELVRMMKRGSIVFDLRIGQGGCFETTCSRSPSSPMIFEEYGVLHYCQPDVSNTVARTTTMALSNIFVPMIARLGDIGNISTMIKGDLCFRNGVYMYFGKSVNSYVSNHFHLSANNLDIYLSAF